MIVLSHAGNALAPATDACPPFSGAQELHVDSAHALTSRFAIFIFHRLSDSQN